MELTDINSCKHTGQVYPEASQLCCHEVCMVCKEGEWVETRRWPREEEDSEQVMNREWDKTCSH